MVTDTLKIHSENILPIIKKWLYTDKDIFVRELVSNGCDALRKLEMLRHNQHAPSGEEELRVDITIDKTKKTLTFSDNGIGMDAEEVKTYIAQIAFSGAEDFVKKYQSKKEEDQIIGHFGLGFYSCYMVAKDVKLETLSFKDKSESVLWRCDGSSQYTLDSGNRQTRGTDVILSLSEEEEEYLDAAYIRQILKRYCAYLPFPIYLNGSRINDKIPLWIKSATDCQDKEYLDLYRDLFPQDPEPLFWIHLNVDYPFNLKGILYFPKIADEGDLKKEGVKLFCNRVFVSDNCKDILPDYLTILRGVIDSPDIPLNVSRSTLQMDKTVRQLGTHISKKISDRLSALYRTERERFYSYWEDIEIIIKYGILQDEKFYERVKEFLIWKNSQNEWTTIEDYLAKRNQKTVYYASEDKLSSPFFDLYQKKNQEVLIVRAALIDQAVIQLIEKKTDAKFLRIDSDLNASILDPAREKTLLDAEGKTESSKIADFFRSKLSIDNLKVEAKSLASDSFPAFLLIKEEERRLRDSLAYQNRDSYRQARAFVKPTLVINTNSKLIQAIHTVSQKDPQLAREMVHEVYDLARLAQREMEPDALPKFINRSAEVLEKLAALII